MPGSEIGVDNPMCVYESDGRRLDVDLREALKLSILLDTFFSPIFEYYAACARAA